MVFIRRHLWSGILTILSGVFSSISAMMLNYLVLFTTFFVNIFKLTSMMELLFLVGIGGRIFSLLVSLVMYRHPHYNALSALYSQNPDQQIWLDSYKEEYEGLSSNDTFDVISEEEYFRRCKFHELKPCHQCVILLSNVPTVFPLGL